MGLYVDCRICRMIEKILSILITITRHSCSIGLTDHVVVTGGSWLSNVLATKYNLDGWMEDLPALNDGRQNHACAWYRDDAGTLVYLVTGGWRWEDPQPLSSTEILSSGSPQWSFTSPLPYSISGLSAVTVDNIPFLFGNIIAFMQFNIQDV